MENQAKTIWYLHHYAGAPELGMSYRPYYLVKHLRELGYKAHIVASAFHHLFYVQREQKDNIKTEIIDTVPYIWFRTPKYSGNKFQRLQNMLVYAYKIWRYHKQLIALTGRPDIIIVSSTHPFHYMSAKWLAKKYRAKIIFEVRDLWPLSLTNLLHTSKAHPLVIMLGWLEKYAYKTADMVVSLLPNAFVYMKTKGLVPEKFTYIPNGVDSEECGNNIDLNNEQYKKIFALKQQGKFIVMYLGAHGIPNALGQLVEAAARIQENNRAIHFVLIGKGHEKKRLIEKATCLENVTFLEPISKHWVPEFLAKADVAYMGLQNVEIFQYGISPNKLFDYMLAAKPIIMAVNTYNDPVSLAQCGIIVPPQAPDKLATAILKIFNQKADEREAMGMRGREYVVKNHDYKLLSEKYHGLFMNILKS